MKKPPVYYWTLIYLILGIIPVLGFCLWAVKDGWYPSEAVLSKHPDPSAPFYLFNRSLAYVVGILTVLSTIPIWILLFGKQKSWVWTTTLVFICLALPNNPFVGIPVLIFWIKPKNKEYYMNPPPPFRSRCNSNHIQT